MAAPPPTIIYDGTLSVSAGGVGGHSGGWGAAAAGRRGGGDGGSGQPAGCIRRRGRMRGAVGLCWRGDSSLPHLRQSRAGGAPAGALTVSRSLRCPGGGGGVWVAAGRQCTATVETIVGGQPMGRGAWEELLSLQSSAPHPPHPGRGEGLRNGRRWASDEAPKHPAPQALRISLPCTRAAVEAQKEK